MTAIETPADLDNLIQAYGPGTGILVLSKRFGIPKRQVARILRAQGLIKTRAKAVPFTDEEIAGLFGDGMHVRELAHLYHTRGPTIVVALNRQGIHPVIPGLGSRRDVNGRISGPLKPIDTTEVVRQYREGTSVSGIARNLSLQHQRVKVTLIEAGITPHTQAEVNRRMFKAHGQEWTAAWAEKGRESVRRNGHKPSWFINQAIGHQRGLSKMGVGEQVMASWLIQRGLNPILQFAWESYNIDIGLLPVAVEVHRGASFPLHNPRERAKLKNLTNAGLHVIWIWFNDSKGRQIPLTEAAADYIITFLKESQTDPSPIGQYRVIRGTGELIAEGRCDFDNLPFVLAPARYVKLGQH